MTMSRMVHRFKSLAFACFWRGLITPHEVAREVEYMLLSTIEKYLRKASA